MSAPEPLAHAVQRPLSVRAISIRRIGWARSAFLLLCAAAFAFVVLQPMYPSYDGYYSLVWAREIVSGSLPGFAVPVAPTQHPMALLIALLSLPFGTGAERIYVAVTVAAFVALIAAVYALGARLFNGLVGAVAAVIVLTRLDLLNFVSRGFVDIPFLALIVWGAVAEARRPRNGVTTLALFTAAGLFRPEAWLFAGLYALYCFRGATWSRRAWYSALVALGPAVWLGLDWAATGDPFFSLTSTRDLAGELGRSRSFLSVVTDLPNLMAKTIKLSIVLAGAAGLAYGVYAFGRRLAIPLAVAAVGLATFLTTSAIGLSVNVRYLAVPSVIFCLGAAVAIGGWRDAAGRARRVGLAVAVVSFALIVARIPGYDSQASRLYEIVTVGEDRHDSLADLLHNDRVRALLDRCAPMTVPGHQQVPMVRYILHAGAAEVVPSTFQSRPPERGLLLVTTNPEFKLVRGPADRVNFWSNIALRGFHDLAANGSWRLLGRCEGPPTLLPRSG